MDLRPIPTLAPFKIAPFSSYAIDGGLSSALSARSELCVEVTFDSHAPNPETFLCVNLITSDGTRRAHLSIRLQQKMVVLNTLDNGKWGQDAGCGIDFMALRFWRLWLILSSEGMLSVKIGHETICSIQTDIPSHQITGIEFDVSAICALMPLHEGHSTSGLLDLEAPRGPTLLFRQQSKALEDAANSLGLGIRETRMMRIASADWLLVVFDNFDSTSVILDDNGQKSRIYDVRAMPVVEVSSGYLAFRSSLRFPPQNIEWKQKDSDCYARSRLTSLPGELEDDRNFGFNRLITPLSEFLRLIRSRNDSTVTLNSADGSSVDGYSISLGPTVLLALERWIIRYNTSFKDAPLDWQMIVLDWWTSLIDHDQRDLIQSIAPKLFQFLRDQGDMVGTGTEILRDLTDQLSLDENSGGSAPKPDDILLWRALRSLDEAFAEHSASKEQIGASIEGIFRSLPSAQRNWMALQLSATLISLRLGSHLASAVSREFISEVLADNKQVWRYSSISAVLGVIGDFDQCISILGTIAKQVPLQRSNELNISAISASLGILSESDISLKQRRRLVRALTRLLTSFDCHEFSAFRNIDLIEATVRLLVRVRHDPSELQDELLTCVTSVYSTVPEFWLSLSRRLPLESRDSFSRLMRDRIDIALAINEFFASVSAGPITDAKSSTKLPITISAMGQRLRYLNNFIGLHAPGQLGILPSSDQNVREIFLRVAALPSAFKSFTEGRSWSHLSTREHILELQPYKRAAKARVLESLGIAAAEENFEEIFGWIPSILDNSLGSDKETEAVAIDVAIWALIFCRKDDLVLNSLAVCVLEKMKGSINGASLPAALHSSVRRLMLASSERLIPDYLTNLIREEYRRKFAATVAQAVVEAPEDRHAFTARAFFSDTIVAVITCKDYLKTRATECKETWVKDCEALGAKVIFFHGADFGETETFDRAASTVCLPVGDLYEDLPSKILAVFSWIEREAPCSFVIKVDDDCYLDAFNYLTTLSYRRGHYFGRPLTAFPRTFDRAWHQSRSARVGSKRAFDTSPLGSKYADGGGSYALSRFAVGALKRVSVASFGVQLRLSSFFEDKLVGDLLRQGGIDLSSVGYTSIQSRRNYPSAIPVLQIDRSFYPSDLSGIGLAHLDQTGLMSSIRHSRGSSRLFPPRIFPMNVPLSLSFSSNMLEVLDDRSLGSKLESANFVCVSVFRNERTIIPHFLEHYRELGVDLFLAVDNLSDDGTREYLSQQKDVALFSASSDYKTSHFGVDWQRALLDHFCPGRWVIVADADEFLITEGERPASLRDQCRSLEANGFDSAIAIMVDMYPKGRLSDADFSKISPRLVATAFDSTPALRWRHNKGPFGNFESYVSSLRHRIMPMSSPEMFTSQKICLFRFNPLMSFSEGFHFGAGLKWSTNPLAFLHYKYSADFIHKARRESRRLQHFDGAREYKSYLSLAEQDALSFWREGTSIELKDSHLNPLNYLLRNCGEL